MTDKTEGRDWAEVDSVVVRSGRSEALPAGPMHPLTPPQALPTPTGQRVEPEGVIARFQANKLERKYAIEFLKSWYSEALDVTRHQLAEAGRVKRAEATVMATQLLERLNAEHLSHMVKLGLTNVSTRMEALTQLNELTAGHLADIMDKDWPNALKESAMKDILLQQERFAARLRQELGEAGA